MKINKLFPALLVWFVLLLGPTPFVSAQVEHGFSKERLTRYENFLRAEIEEGRIPGAVSLIKRRGAIAHERVLGVKNTPAQTPMALDDIFFIQSMTKPIITVAFMMLYEEGHFFLDDPVSTYIPEFKDRVVLLNAEAGKDGATEPANKEITIAHLLSHTAGLSHGLGPTEIDRDYLNAMYFEEHATVEDRVIRMLDLPLIGHPGEQWQYSAAPDVLSVLIKKFSGMSTEKFLQERLFDPLGMDDTGYNLPQAKHDRVVQVHQMDSTNALVVRARQPQMAGNTIHSGVNGLFSTAKDYMTFCEMMLNNGELNGKRYLSRKTIELMTINHVDELYGEGQGFGFGYGVTTDLAASDILGSEGTYYWGGAFCTYFFIDPEEEMVAILMTQLNPYSNYYRDKMIQFVYQAIDD